MSKISALPTDTAPASADLFPFVDVTASRTEAVTVANLATAITGEVLLDEDDMASDSATAPPSQQSVKAYVDNNTASAGPQDVNAQTGTSYTLVAADAAKLVTMDNASASTLTVPQDSAATIAVGTYVDIMQLGAGQVTVTAGAGATLRVSGLTAKARAQYSRLGVQKVSANTWSLFGDLASS